MKFHVGLPTDHVSAGAEFVSADGIAVVARAAEDAGFDSVFVTEHPYPEDAWLATGGHHALDPFVALSFAASATTTRPAVHQPLRRPVPEPLPRGEGGADPRRAVGRATDARRRRRLPGTRVPRPRRRLRGAERAARRGAGRDQAGVDRERRRDDRPALRRARAHDAAAAGAVAAPADLGGRQLEAGDPACRRPRRRMDAHAEPAGVGCAAAVGAPRDGRRARGAHRVRERVPRVDRPRRTVRDQRDADGRAGSGRPRATRPPGSSTTSPSSRRSGSPASC